MPKPTSKYSEILSKTLAAKISNKSEISRKSGLVAS